MAEESKSGVVPDHARTYQISLDGQLGDQWSDWFEGMAIQRDADGCTTLTGTIIDDAALYGLLKKIRDLRLSLLSVNSLEPGRNDAKRSLDQ